jgi:hypothetical protein
MTRLLTNRDLYLAANELTKTKGESQPSLEAYLLALRQLGMQHESKDSIGLDEFYSMLRDAFSTEPPPFDATWVNEHVAYTKDEGFSGWLATITSQIVDLHEMAESGDLQNKWRYFGIQSPRGSHWYNFDPCGYLECAMAGWIGGWEPEDESGRSYVPGPVAVLDANDQIVTVNLEDAPRPVYSIPTISWTLFRDILYCGQTYE